MLIATAATLIVDWVCPLNSAAAADPDLWGAKSDDKDDSVVSACSQHQHQVPKMCYTNVQCQAILFLLYYLPPFTLAFTLPLSPRCTARVHT